MAENQPSLPETEAGEDAPLIDINELAETSSVRPAEPKPPPRPGGRGRVAGRKDGAFWQTLQVLIILLIVVWIFLLGVLVGRSRLGESDLGLAGWLEKMGWSTPLRTVIIEDAEDVRPAPAAGHLPAREDQPLPPPPLSSSLPDPPAPEMDYDEPLEPAAAPEPLADWPAPEEATPEEPASPAIEEPVSLAPDPAETPDPIPANGPQFSIQTALEHEETEARNRVARLKAQGFKEAYFYQKNHRFPVRVGPFSSRAEAEEIRRQLESLGYKNPYISVLR